MRQLTISQVAETFFAETRDPIRQARKRLRRLTAASYIEKHTIAAHPPLLLKAPLYRHAPGNSAPDLGAIAYRLRQRWNKVLVPTDIVIATEQSRRLLGGFITPRKPRASERSHDLSLAELFLLLYRNHPELAAKWQSEDELRARGISIVSPLPDAVIADAAPSGAPLLIEFGGSYVKAKLTRIHNGYKEHHYELW